MDSTVAWVVGGGLFVLLVVVLVMGGRISNLNFGLGKWLGWRVETQPDGARVSDATAEGKRNQITAEGSKAVTERVSAKGDENIIGAKTNQ